MKKERLHTAINDAELNLHRLAKLMPGLATSSSLAEILRLVHDATGARLSCIMLEAKGLAVGKSRVSMPAPKRVLLTCKAFYASSRLHGGSSAGTKM